MTARRVGEFALECLTALDGGQYELANTRESHAAIADLRALMAESEAWREKCASMTKYAGDMQAECARLRAALERIGRHSGEAANSVTDNAREWGIEYTRSVASDFLRFAATLADEALAHEERSGAAASTAGVKP